MSTLEEQFLSRIDKDGDCWLWNGAKNKQGEGVMNYNRKYMLAARVSYYIYEGRIPQARRVESNCGNANCVNPKHLQLEETRVDFGDEMAYNKKQRNVLKAKNAKPKRPKKPRKPPRDKPKRPKDRK